MAVGARPWGLVVGFLVVGGCAKSSAALAPPAAASADPVVKTGAEALMAASLGACAVFETGPSPEQCAEPNRRGRIATLPLEWGPAAVGDLYKGLVVCPSGAMATLTRDGNLGRTQVEVEGLPSPMLREVEAMLGEDAAKVGGGDMVDVWRVSCPERPDERWFTNLYRCGNPCAPEGFSVVPYAVADALVAARDAGDLQALAAARQGWEDVGFSWRVTASTALRAGDPFVFLDAMLALDELRPLDEDELGALGRVVVDLDAPSALPALRRGLRAASRDAIASVWARCGVGLAERALGDAVAGQALIDGACNDGTEACCAE